MRMNSAGLFIVIVLLLPGYSLAKTPKISWQDGRVVSAALNGHGPNTVRVAGISGRQDIWWNYCISTADQSYSVVSRLNPRKSGLLKDKQIKFSERKNQIFVLKPAGGEIGLRILRKSVSGKCSE